MNTLSIFAKLQRHLLAYCFLLMSVMTINVAHAQKEDDFFKAVAFDNVEKVALYIEQGYSPNLQEKVRGESALMVAIREQSERVFLLLMTHKKIDFEVKANNGDTALMLAAYLKQSKMLTSLIEHGARVNQDGWTALHYAAASAEAEMVQILLAHNAKVDALSPNHSTPLMMAIRSASLDIVKLLVERGANIELKNQVGMTALDFAVYYEQRDIQAYLESLQKSLQKTQ
jgi:ankyrin repeat protein